MDDEFDGLQPGSTSSIARASTIPQAPEPPQEQPAQQPPSSNSAEGLRLKQGQFAKSYQQFLETDPSSRTVNAPFDDFDDDDDEDMVKEM